MDSYFQNLSKSVDPVIAGMGIDSDALVQDILAAVDIESTYCSINETQDTIQETANQLEDRNFPNIVCLNDCAEGDVDCSEQRKKCIVQMMVDQFNMADASERQAKKKDI